MPNELNDQERLLFACSTHWVKYVIKALRFHVFALIGLSLLLIAYYVADLSEVAALATFCTGSILLMLTHHLFFHLLMSEEMVDIIVTSDRVIYFNDCLFTCDDEHEVPLNKVTAVKVEQHGIWQNILNYGTVWFDTGSGTLDLKRSVPNVPKPEEVGRIISTAVKET